MRKRVNFGLKKFGLAKASAWEKKTSLLGDGDYFLGDGDALLGDGGEIIVDSGHHNVITLCEGSMSATKSTSLSAILCTSMSATMTWWHHVHLHLGHHVHSHVGHHVSHQNVISTLCEGSETLTEWKSESITYLRTGLGARDDCAIAHLKIYQYIPIAVPNEYNNKRKEESYKMTLRQRF